MYIWLSHAFIRYLLFFSAGILLAIYQPESIGKTVLSSVSIAFCLFMSGVLLLRKKNYYQFNPLMGLTACALLFLCGYQHLGNYNAINNPLHIIHHTDTREITYYRAKVIERMEEKANSWKTTMQLSAIYDGEKWVMAEGKINTYFSKRIGSLPSYGDILLINGSPKELDEPKNPYEFNFKRFISFQNIYHQHFVRPGSFIPIAHKPDSRLYKYAITLRSKLAQLLQDKLTESQSAQIAKALVLGIKDDLDQETTKAYAAAGAMHVLAVSGLHVGIVYGFLLLLIGKWKDDKQLRWVFLLICLSFLWAYALLTGLSPSVQRAATMFSFIVIAQVLKRNSNIYNTLAASALFLLCFNPYLLMSVGFQLSYLAVLGIVYIQPKLYHLFETHHTLTDKIWAITCVSVAAQLATAPLGLLYFHQFPTYFFVSNLLVIPAAFIILCGGLITLTLSVFPLLSDWSGMALHHIITFLNRGVSFIENLPYSTIEGVLIDTPQSWMLYLFIFSLLFFLEKRKLEFLVLSAFFMAIFQFIGFRRYQHNFSTAQLTVYHITNHSVWELIDKNEHFVCSDEQVKHEPDKLKFHVFPQQLQMGLVSQNNAKIQTPTFKKRRQSSFADFYLFNGISIMHWYQLPSFQSAATNPPEVDYLIISNNACKGIKQLLDNCKPGYIIFDSSNKNYLLKYFKEELEKLNLPYHDVTARGAFTKKLKNGTTTD